MTVEYTTLEYRSSVIFDNKKQDLCSNGSTFDKVSAVIITFNEEGIIERTLKQLWWCNEIIIIDSGSTDKTIEICSKFNCRIYYHKFNGFGEQKRFGISKADNNWILCIDADEVLTEPLINEIRNELSIKDIIYSGFTIPRNLVFMNKVFKYGKEANDTVIRLFNKDKGNWDGAIVHEKVLLQGPVKKLSNKILHYSYHNYSQFMYKVNIYSSMGANKLFAKKSTKGKSLILVDVVFNFFKYYIINLNFLNGFYGFVWSYINTVYHFMKYLKLSELYEKE